MVSQLDKKVLVVDDEAAVRQIIAESLSEHGWEVGAAASGEEALIALEAEDYSIILLDLRMMGMSGLAVMREVSRRWPEKLIIIMTAYASTDSAIQAVRYHAFDYLRKPFTTQDILLRVRRAWQTIQERHQEVEQAQRVEDNAPGAQEERPPLIVQTGDLRIDLRARQVWQADVPITLTPTEHEILALLAHSPGQPVSLQTLIAEGLNYDPEERQARETLRVHVSRLRGKIGSDYIRTIRGGGYMLADLPGVND